VLSSAREDEAKRLFGVHLELRAEASAHVGGDDPELGLGDSRRAGQGHARDVRNLTGRPHRELTRRRDRLHEHRARLDGIRDEPLLPVPALDGHGSVGERFLGGAF